MTTGRSGQPKPTFTFSSGVTVALERVGPLFAMPIQRANPPPAPPLAPGVGGQLEPNPADPDYEKVMAAHNQKVSLIIQDALIDMGISDDTPVDPEAVNRVRRIYERAGAGLEESDRMVYLKYVCITDVSDISGLIAAIRSYDVTEEVVTAAAAMFQRDGARATTGGDLTDVAEVEAAV